jgi:hypothetical protein
MKYVVAPEAKTLITHSSDKVIDQHIELQNLQFLVQKVQLPDPKMIVGENVIHRHMNRHQFEMYLSRELDIKFLLVLEPKLIWLDKILYSMMVVVLVSVNVMVFVQWSKWWHRLVQNSVLLVLLHQTVVVLG